MSKVALFNQPVGFSQKKDVFEMTSKDIRYGIASLAGYLRAKDIDVIIVDPVYQSVEQIGENIRKFQPDYAGVHSFTTEIRNADATMKFVKDIVPSVKTVIGGPHVSSLPEETIREFSGFDIGVIGEGERTMTDIALGKDWNAIDGIIFRENGVITQRPPRELIQDLSELARPAFDLYDERHYSKPARFGRKKEVRLWLETMRGCPFTCNFCFRTIGKTSRFKKPELFLDELQYYIKRFGLNKVTFLDGTFCVNKAVTSEILNGMIERGIHKKITWSAGTRANTVNEEMIGLFKRAGCFQIDLGIESGDDAVLKASHKGITTENVRSVIQWCKKYKLPVSGCFIFGLPGDTKETIHNTIEFAKRLPLVTANFAILVPFPGTEIYHWAQNKEMGYYMLSHDYADFGKQEGRCLGNERISREELLELQKLAYQKFYLSSIRRMKKFLSIINARQITGIVKRLIGIK